MYAIKIMSSEDKADSDVGKGFKIILVDTGDTFEFGHDQATGKPQVTVTGVREGEATFITYPVTGNCYVLSSTGKTIATFWGRSLWEATEQDTSPEFEVITPVEGSPFRTIKITLDPKDTQPERTIDAIQSIVMNYAKKAFPAAGSLEEMKAAWIECGLTNTQIALLQNGPTVLKHSLVDRDLSRRARVGYLTSQGIPFNIAMDATVYMLDVAPRETAEGDTGPE